jgi:hypothetical protein
LVGGIEQIGRGGFDDRVENGELLTGTRGGNVRRREFLAGTGIFVGAACAPSVAAADDETAIKQSIKDCYSIFYTERDKQKYRSLLTADYLLLEKGEILDADHDIALMPAPGKDYKRTDTFDFRTIKVQNDMAFVVYIVKSDILNKKKTSQNGVWQFLESAILRRSDRWRIALLHSTQITKPRA